MLDIILRSVVRSLWSSPCQAFHHNGSALFRRFRYDGALDLRLFHCNEGLFGALVLNI